MTGKTGTSSTTSGTTPSPLYYVNLPAPGHKLAPKTFKGNYREIDRFLELYGYVCVQNKVMDPKHRCLGLIRFCSNRVADLIEGLDEFIAKDWNALAKKLRWVYDGEKKKARYHIRHIGEFAKAWRKEEIPSLEVFKQYHQEYLQLAGTLKVAGCIDEKDFNQGFWEGLNQETRDRIERRMMDDDPSLDLCHERKFCSPRFHKLVKVFVT